MASGCVTRGCSKAQQSLVDRCFAGASQKLKEAALLAVQQLPAYDVARLDSRGAGAAGFLNYLVAHVGDSELCKLLVKHNKELAGEELVYAAACGKEERVRELLAEGVPVDANDSVGRTPLLAVAMSFALHTNVDLQLRIARMLLEAGASVDATLPEGATALEKSIYRGRYALAELLLDAGASTNVTQHDGHSNVTFLHVLVAAAGEDTPGTEGWEIGRLARKLVAAGVPVDEDDNDELTALMLAVNTGVSRGMHCEGLLAMAETLLDLGADPRVQEDIGCGVLVEMAATLNSFDPEQPMHIPNFRRLLQRLVAAGADINSRCSTASFTVLGLMCKACSKPSLGPPEPLLRALVEAGADLRAQQALPLPLLILVGSPGRNAPAALRALAALGYPMDTNADGMTTLQFHLQKVAVSLGKWPNQRPPSDLQLSCIEALVDTGCPLVAGHLGSGADDACYWLVTGIRTGSVAVVQALLRACPDSVGDTSLWRATPFEQATEHLCCVLACQPADQLEHPLEGKLGKLVLYYCTVAPVLLAAGSPPVADKYLNLSALPPSCQEQLRFLPLVARGSSWSTEAHHLYPHVFCAAARQLLLIHECCGFGAGQPSSGQASGAGRKRRAGSRRSRNPVRALGIQLPREVLHHIFRLASQPLLDWVPSLAAKQ